MDEGLSQIGVHVYAQGEIRSNFIIATVVRIFPTIGAVTLHRRLQVVSQYIISMTTTVLVLIKNSTKRCFSYDPNEITIAFKSYTM